MRKLTIILIIVFFSLDLKAQDIIFEKITTRQGLSQNDVNCIFQDHNGFLWVGTNDGLNRYDGYSFKTFQIDLDNSSKTGLSSNLIWRVKEDKKGNLWIATLNEGVCKFNVEKELFIPVCNNIEKQNEQTDNRMLDLECMDDGSVWVASVQGINIISEKNGKFNIKSLNKTSNIVASELRYCIAKDVYQRKWIGSTNGLVVYNADGNNLEFRIIPEFKDVAINTLLSLRDGIIVGTSSGVYYLRYDGQNLDRYLVDKFSDLNCRAILFDKNQDLFVATNQGLYTFSYDLTNKSSFVEKAHYTSGLTENELNSDILTCLFEDESGIVWIGTNGGGLNKYNPKHKKFNHYKHTTQTGSLSHNKIRAIYEDSDDNIWIGTEGGGMNYLSSTKNKNFSTGFINYYFDTKRFDNIVYSIAEVNIENSKKIWAGVGYPLYIVQFILNRNSDQVFKRPDIPILKNSVFTLLKDKDENIWVGTYGTTGLFKYEKTIDGYQLLNYKAGDQPDGLSSNIIRSLLQDKQGNVWIGTDSGLNLLSATELGKKNPKFKVFRNKPGDKSSLSHNYILPLFESNDGDLWLGTMGGGLNKINYKNDIDSITFISYTTKDGLPNNIIKGILEDDYGFLWISSNKGLSRFDPSSKNFMNYDISDGLQDFEFGELACCRLRDGMMIFGGVNGFNTFYPEQITGDMSVPKVVFTDLQILNQSVLVGERIHNRVVLDKVINHSEKINLKYSENSFAIYYSALHFSAPGKNMYKYMLEGFDQDWIKKSSNERFAKYTNLKPGKYIFKITASNNDGVWSGSNKQIEITIVPPWWQSNLFLIACVMSIVWMVWLMQKYSIIRIKQKNELLMEHFEKEKIEELSQMKFQFFTNISHEFRTPLTLIIGSIEKLLKRGDEFPNDLQNKHSVIHRNASILLRLINQLVDFRKFERGKTELRVSQENIVSFLENIFSSFSDCATIKNIKFNLTCPKDEIYLWIDTDKMEKIIYNLLSNAFKFTLSGGQIDLELKDKHEVITICVIDTGIGIPKDLHEHIFERFYQATKINQNNLGGTGIGLSYAKGLAKLHHGDISFTSIEGEGSCFELLLKKGNSHFEASELIINQETYEPVEKPSLRIFNEIIADESIVSDTVNQNKSTLLIVEDNFELRQFLHESFCDEYNIINAENGEIGLSLAHEYNPNLVISDIMMPLKNGFELCHNIKNDERLSHIPVILLTARTSTEDTIKGFANGADAYIPKPFDIEILAAQVKSIILTHEKLRKKLRKSIEVIPSEVTTTSMDEKFLSRMLKIIEEHISDSEFSVERLSDLYGMSQISMNKKLKSLTGMTTNVFIRNIRLKRAAQLLKTGRYSVADVTYEVGFSDLKYFRSCFKTEFTSSPSDYIRQHKELHQD